MRGNFPVKSFWEYQLKWLIIITGDQLISSIEIYL